MYATLMNAADADTDVSMFVYVGGMARFSVQALFEGEVTGTMKISGSCDYIAEGGLTPVLSAFDPPDPDNASWDDFDGQSVTVSAAGTHTFDFPVGSGVAWIRVNWTHSGTPTGTVTAKFHGR